MYARKELPPEMVDYILRFYNMNNFKLFLKIKK